MQKEATMPKKIITLSTLLSLALIVAPTAAQSSTPSAIVVTFAEAPPLEDCVRAISAAAGSRIIADHDGGALDRLPIINDSGEASGTAPECWLYSGAALDLRLNQAATSIAFNRSGTVWVQLYRNNALVHEAESSGLGGRYTYQHGGGFNRIIIREAGDGPASYVALDDLQLDVPDLTVSHLTRFAAMGATSCAEQLAIPDWLTADGGTLINGACTIASGEALTIRSTRPFQYWDAVISGEVTLLLQTTSAAESPQTVATDGPYFVQERDPADYVQLQIVGGTDGATVTDIRLTWVLADPVADGAAAACPDGVCSLAAGEAITLNFPAPLWAAALTVSGDVLIEAFRDGELVDVWRGSGLAGVRVVAFWGGFDTLIIREAGQRDAARVQVVNLFPLPSITP